MDGVSNHQKFSWNRKALTAFWCFIFIVFAFSFIFHPLMADAQRRTQGRTCGTMPIHNHFMETDDEYAYNQQALEEFTEFYRNWGPGFRVGEIVIPVVVHVVYNQNNPVENVSMAQIQSQIDILNEDYRMLNTDISQVPPAFQPYIDDARIRFQLAVRDPNCQPTNGVTRTSTTATSFAATGDPVKFTATGGMDAWPRDKYLNIWVCDIYEPGIGGLLGYAQFPGGAAATDGVVIDYQAFGDIGTASAPFDKGRSATHEIGHWLNLRHIWGDDSHLANQCVWSDFCDDTPNQADEHYGCPSFPQVSCNNGPDGDMFMNYMDYVDDDCMVMFTSDQCTRMAAAIFGQRYALLGSDALIPPLPAEDLYSQDSPEDLGDEPNVVTTVPYHTDDIWVRNQQDGMTYHEHENPIYCDPSDPNCQPNWVYVRVRNRGCTNPQSGNVKLYWAKAGGYLQWPAPWDGSVTNPLMGGLIGTQPTGLVAAGDHVILEYSWYPPDPNNYTHDPAHFCLLSRIETSSTAPYGMTFPETGNLGSNVLNNNNIVWKNISVIYTTTSGGSTGGKAAVYVGNINLEGKEIKTKLTFDEILENGKPTLFEWGTINVDLGEMVFEKWQKGGFVGKGIKVVDKFTIQIIEPGAWIENIVFKPGEFDTVTLQVEPFNPELPTQNNIFKLNLAQHVFNGKMYELFGGEVFVVKSLKEEQKVLKEKK